jgi:hypothetical protein
MTIPLENRTMYAQGSLEFMHACTTMDDPFEIYDPVAEQTHKEYDWQSRDGNWQRARAMANVAVSHDRL